MSRFARVMSMQSWLGLNDEDEAGFEGRRRRRRRQRRREKRQGGAGRAAAPRRMERPTSGGRSLSRSPAARGQEQEQAPEDFYDEPMEELPEDLEEVEDDLGALPRRPLRAVAQRVRAVVRPKAGDKARPSFGPGQDLGPNLKIRARKGFRAAIVEVKPGLFVVAEVPERSVELGFGPLLLAPALVKTLGRVFRRNRDGQDQPVAPQEPKEARRPALPGPERRALPGPTAQDEDRLARWIDDDVAAELGCRACNGRG